MKRAVLLLSLLLIAIPVGAQNVNYYFHDTDSAVGKLMDSSHPTAGYPAYINLDEGAAIWSSSPFSSDTKISGDVSVTVFIEAFFLKPDAMPIQMRFIKVTLLDITPSGNMDPIAASKVTPIIFISNNTVKHPTIIINNVDYTIPQGDSLGIKIEKAINLMSYFPFSMLSPFFATYILYDSRDECSFAEIPINMTGGGISLECYDREESVKPGESVDYGIMIYNTGSSDDVVSFSHNYNGNEWKVEISPQSVNVKRGGFNYTTVTVTAPEDAEPGDYLNITITGVGSNGASSVWLNTSIAPYSYGVSVTAKDSEKTGEPGDKVNFTFNVKNTGDLTDTYSLGVTCVWDTHLSENNITLEPGKSKDVVVAVDIPLNASNGTVQLVVLTAKSMNDNTKESSARAQLTVIYTTPPAPESGGGINPGYILVVIGVIFLIVIAAYLSKISVKSIELYCDERMKEISPGRKAEFLIKLKNPMDRVKDGKNRIKYRIGIEGSIPERWTAKVDRDELILDGGEEAEIRLTVQPPSDASYDEWASVDLVVYPSKGKSERLNLLITLREPQPLLETSYEHEGEMEEGNKVITRVKIENEGDADADNVRVSILVNGKEKNRVEGIRIPAGGYVEVSIPWIAEEENDVEVRVEEIREE
ncbi:MAG: hypothetical protein J7K61_03235 [Thermoplasmata archaeon]|nr:hypothetical protein [Thermoplasmata archaeon]